MGRYALLVATGRYSDPKLSLLRAPTQDVARLSAVLGDPERGGFDDVQVLRDGTDHEIRAAIDDLLADRFADDLVLLYLSCHGLVTQHGRLYFAATETRHDRPGSSAVSRTFVNEQLEDCHAGGRILLLDCCFSGAFGEGFKAGSAAALDGRVGQGYVVMTACDAFEYAYEAGSPSLAGAGPTSSIFTDVLVDGLVTGAADRDGDGWVTADELFRYVHDTVVRQRPEQRPRFFAHAADSHLYLAKAPASVRLVPDATADGPAVRFASAGQRIAAIEGMVARTLGPLGGRVAVPDGHGGSVETDDVRTIVTQLEAQLPQSDPGAGYLRDLVERVEREAGDGTATAVIIASALVSVTALAIPDAHVTPWLVKRGMELAAVRVREALAGMARDIETKEDLAALGATCTADPALGRALADAFDLVGKEGLITLEPGRTAEPEVEVEEGFRFAAGFRSPHFVTRTDRPEAALDDPYLLITDGELSSIDDVLPIMECVVGTGRGLVVVAAGIDGDALAALVQNKVRGILAAVAVQAPGSGVAREVFLEDLAVLTGGVVLSRRYGLDLRKADVTMLGTVRRVVVGPDSTLVVDGTGDLDTIIGRIEQVRADLEQATGPERDEQQARLARLAGAHCRVRFGPADTPEAAERTRRAARAIRVMRETIEHGTVPGGGVALFAAASTAAGTLDLDGRERDGASILLSALAEPLLYLARTASTTALTREDLPGLPAGTGIDVLTGRRVDMRTAGIVDSAKVLQAAVDAAVTLAGRLLLAG